MPGGRNPTVWLFRRIPRASAVPLGSTIAVVTTIFAILLIASFGSAISFVRTIIDAPVVLIGCLVSMLIAVALNLVYDDPDPSCSIFHFDSYFRP